MKLIEFFHFIKPRLFLVGMAYTFSILYLLSCNHNPERTVVNFQSYWDTIKVLENPHKERCQHNPERTGELLNQDGYWYFPVSASFNPLIKKRKNIIEFAWLNKGVAPAYKSFSLILGFEGIHTNESFKLNIGDAGNLKWLPGIVHNGNIKFNLPPNIKKGDYVMKFKLMDIESDTQKSIFMGLKDSALDETHFITLGEVRIN